MVVLGAISGGISCAAAMGGSAAEEPSKMRRMLVDSLALAISGGISCTVMSLWTSSKSSSRQHHRQEYFRNYDELEMHFQSDHFFREDRECLKKKFIVFQSEAELKRHNAVEHREHKRTTTFKVSSSHNCQILGRGSGNQVVHIYDFEGKGSRVRFGEKFSPERAKGYQFGMVALFDNIEELVSFGENFSLAWAKGYQFGIVAVFDSVEELDVLEGDAKVEEAKAALRPLLDEVMVLDFVVDTPMVVASL